MKKYPRVHVVTGDTGAVIEVWLNTDVQNFDGVCIGNTVTEAVANLEAALEVLQRKPSPEIYRPA